MGTNRIPINLFFKKPAHEKVLLFRVFVLLFAVRLLLFILPFRLFSKLLGKPGSESPQTDQHIKWDYVELVSRFIRNFSRMVPWDSRCLAQAAAGKILMRRKNIPGTVYFGVKKGDDNQKIQAHAWLRVGSKIILGGKNASEFVVVSNFS